MAERYLDGLDLGSKEGVNNGQMQTRTAPFPHIDFCFSNFLFYVVDPQEGRQYLCNHSPVCGAGLPENEGGAEEI